MQIFNNLGDMVGCRLIESSVSGTRGGRASTLGLIWNNLIRSGHLKNGQQTYQSCLLNCSCGPDGEDGRKEMVDGGEVQRFDSSRGALQPNSSARCTQQVHQCRAGLIYWEKKNGQKELTVSAH